MCVSQGYRLAIQKLLSVVNKCVPDSEYPLPPSWRRKLKTRKGEDKTNAVLLTWRPGDPYKVMVLKIQTEREMQTCV